MRKSLIASIAVLPLLSGGCIAKTAFDIATMPIKATAQAADWATTSQDEADRNYGREMRKKEAAEGREMKAKDRQAREDEAKRDREQRDSD